jgi:predicted nucleotidyltransferase
MLQNRSQILNAIKTVALAFGELNEKIVFVGGAVIGLYADDPGAPEVRPTKDIDIVLEITSLLELENLREKFAGRGIKIAKDEKILCRFTYRNIILDVMSTKEVGWAPSNPWFCEGFKHLEGYTLDNVTINLLPVAFYLASKFVAYTARGADPRTSHDFEDIIYILDNRKTWVKDILESDPSVKSFIIDQFKDLRDDVFLQEAVLAHLEPATQIERFEMLFEKLEEITK